MIVLTFTLYVWYKISIIIGFYYYLANPTVLKSFNIFDPWKQVLELISNVFSIKNNILIIIYASWWFI